MKNVRLLFKEIVHEFLSHLWKVPFIYITTLIKCSNKWVSGEALFPFPVCFPNQRPSQWLQCIQLISFSVPSLSLWLSVTVSGMRKTLKCPKKMHVFIRTSLWTRGRWRSWFQLRKRRRVLQRTRWSPWTSACPWTHPRCSCKCVILSIGLICGGRAPAADLTPPDAHLCAPNAVRFKEIISLLRSLVLKTLLCSVNCYLNYQSASHLTMFYSLEGFCLSFHKVIHTYMPNRPH